MMLGAEALSAMAGASLFLFGQWFLLREDARLMDFGLGETQSPALERPRKLSRSEPALAVASGCAWLLFCKQLPGPWPAVTALVPAWATARWARHQYLRSKRLEEMKGQWPVLLESMAVAALSGLDLNAAFVMASKRATGFLKRETDKVVLRLAGGLPLSRALEVLARERVPGAERLLYMFVQCEVLGTPVAEVLESLAMEATDLERQEMEGKFNSLPLKLSVVTVLFLLPPLLIVSIAPHILVFLSTRW
jgi:Flp pilus assembly protein TadB